MIERYTRPEMGEIWSLENKFNNWLKVEILATEALAEMGVVPVGAAKAIKEKATFSVERIDELEKETRHDVVAFTRCVAESLGEEARYVHYGLTSSDVVDTAFSVQLQEAATLIEKSMEEMEDILKEQAVKYRLVPVMGRTHGVHAEPTSVGLKFALWMAEIQRNRDRFQRAREGTAFGKISGAVGNYAHLEPFVEEYVCSHLGLQASPVSTQVLQRDRHAEFIFSLALTGATLEKIAQEVRNLQRTETREMEEPFYSGQKGSSAMPHKRNPVSCEQVTGLSRILRSSVQAALENVALWHERDISHSSVERVIFPDCTILLHYMLHQMKRIIKGLFIYPENMMKNIELTNGLVFSQRVLLELVEKGMSREKAYDLVQKAAMESWEKGYLFKDLLLKNELVMDKINKEELEACFNPQYYLRRTGYIYKKLGINVDS